MTETPFNDVGTRLLLSKAKELPAVGVAPGPRWLPYMVISAPGVSDDGVYRTGGPIALLTSKALFRFDKDRRGFDLQSVHPGYDLPAIKEATGFKFAHDDVPEQTPLPDPDVLKLLRERVYDEVAETYPDFAAQMRREIAQPLSQAS